MTIDERLEALTQTVELIAAMHRDNEKRWEARWEQITQALQQDGEHIRALVRIAEIHERRITDIEGGQQ